MTTLGTILPSPLLPADALRVVADLGDSAHRLDRRRNGAWASFEQLASTARFAGREGYASIARLAAARSRHFARLGDKRNHDRALAAYYRGLAILLFRAARWPS